VITPDSRGHGNSTNPGRTLSYAQLADDVAALIVGTAYPEHATSAEYRGYDEAGRRRSIRAEVEAPMRVSRVAVRCTNSMSCGAPSEESSSASSRAAV
jgi:hypothetical protein